MPVYIPMIYIYSCPYINYVEEERPINWNEKGLLLHSFTCMNNPNLFETIYINRKHKILFDTHDIFNSDTIYTKTTKTRF